MFELYSTLFAINTILFWTVSIVLAIIIIAVLESDEEGWLVPLGALIMLLYGPKILAVVSVSQLLMYAAIYLGIGGGWSVIKWWKYVKDQVAIVRSSKDSYVNLNKINVTYNKARITAWIAAWPFSMFWTMFQDVFSYIYEALVGVYTKIAEPAQAELKGIIEAKEAVAAAEREALGIRFADKR